jgi:hypothetical protein
MPLILIPYDIIMVWHFNTGRNIKNKACCTWPASAGLPNPGHVHLTMDL